MMLPQLIIILCNKQKVTHQASSTGLTGKQLFTTLVFQEE